MVVEMVFEAVLLFILFNYGLSLPLWLSVGALSAIVLAGCGPALGMAIYRGKPVHEILFGNTKRLRGKVLRGLVLLAAVTGVKMLWTLWVLPGSFDDAGQKTELLARRSYLLQEVATARFNAARMPAVFPRVLQQEWGIVTLSMTSAALTNLAFSYPETRLESLAAVKRMLDKMLEHEFSDFELPAWKADPLESLATEKGQIGYLGHLNWMLAAYRLLGGGNEYGKLHTSITGALARRMRNRAEQGYYLETFPQMIFIPDNMVVAASIALYDKIHGPAHAELMADWIRYNKERLVNEKFGVLYPWVSMAGKGFGLPRGSYAAWNSIFLPYIDSEFAAEQWEAVKRNFVVDLPFGMSAVREYPHGYHGMGDIDSGPVIFGLSTSGSGFAVAGARQAADADVYRGLLTLAEFAGTGIGAGDRRYLIAPLIGDAIMLAVRTAVPWNRRYLAGEDI